MRKWVGTFFFTAIVSVLIIGCSDDDKVNPEDVLVSYIEAWESQNYAQMVDVLNSDSIAEIEGLEWDLPERMEEIHETAGVENITVSYTSRDFEEEEIDLDEIEDLKYSVDVQMDTIAGELSYVTDVTLKKEVEEIDGDEHENWLISLHPSHIFLGLYSLEDTVSIENGEYPTRGEIYDRNGRALAENGTVYDVSFVPEAMEDFDDATARLADLLDMDVERVRELADAHPDRPDWRAPITLMSLDDPRKDEVLRIKGILLSQVDGRVYPYGEALAHIIGHTGDVLAEDLENHPDRGYKVDSSIGKRGVELAYEETLRGQRGLSIVVKDSDGETRDVVKSIPTEHGEDITLTIDAELQKQLAETIGDDAGTGIVMNPKTGEVLAMASLPAFDSNLRYLGLRDPRADELEDTNVLFNQRYRNFYAPGSVFKPFTAAIGLEEGTLDPSEVFTIDGKYWQADGSWGDYEVARVNEDVSQVDLETAMKYSDNIYFAMQALEIGQENFETWAEKLGFGDSVPFSYPITESSIANDGLRSDILLADTGYGQGEVQVNPVHLTALYTMFLNDGDVMQPLLLDNEEPSVWLDGIVSPETVETVRDTLISVVEDSNGTANRSNPGHNRSIAGKTGTAELKESRDVVDGDRLGWYVAFDYEREDLLITMMIEGENSGYAVDKVNEFLVRWGD
ncbi:MULTISPECIES: peptidoglycan D,D-transpeptidase FtsI family protein [Bacillaceae]|uniref:serine-type D-Ala-D-Ala carboxypeptidase n=1 Tax=Evansella alkalicola TaxID=745819 RepID=A0ABS6JVW7_9BACI|nr:MULTISPECIES: penicillin-binding protein 2 [Bacillaceae]MBU9722704.1 penicillin-binding transpeptidase domain-containing protein [Bacillus alkalicola]